MQPPEAFAAIIPYVIAASIDVLIFELLARLFPRLKPSNQATPLYRFMLPFLRVLALLWVLLGVPWLVITGKLQTLWLPLIVITIICIVLQVISLFGRNLTTRPDSLRQ